MKGAEHAPRAVVVDLDVVDAYDVIALQGHLDDFLDELFIGSLAEENVDDFSYDAVSGVDDHEADERPGGGVDGQGRKLLGNRRDQDACRGDGVVDTVGCRGFVDAGVDFFADVAVIVVHPALYGDRQDEDADAPVGNFHRLRREELGNRRFAQLVADDEDDYADGQGR